MPKLILYTLTLILLPTLAVSEVIDPAIVRNSDNFEKYKSTFVKAAKKLIENKRCTTEDFLEIGGWIKSYNYKQKPIYFTYCGGNTLKHKIYLNALSGEIFTG